MAIRNYLYTIGVMVPHHVHPLSYLEDGFHSGLYSPIQPPRRNAIIVLRFVNEVIRGGFPLIAPSTREMISQTLEELIRRRKQDEYESDDEYEYYDEYDQMD